MNSTIRDQELFTKNIFLGTKLSKVNRTNSSYYRHKSILRNRAGSRNKFHSHATETAK